MSKKAVTDFLTEKKAFNVPQGVKDFGQAAGKATLNAGATAVAGMAIGGAAVAVKKIFDAATKGRDFRSMLENNPDLAEVHAEDPKRINMYFTTLRTFNPEFSKDPLVAGSYLKQMLSSPAAIGGQMAHALGDHSKVPHPMSDLMMNAASKVKVEGGGAGRRPSPPPRGFGPEFDD
jgi:hypothetical protein